jgi:succinoglycan biosynthesis transport protein ExoP
LSSAQVDLTQAEEKLKSLKTQVEIEAKTYLPSEVVTTNALIEKLRGQISDLEIQLAGFGTDLTAEHPQAVAVRAQRDLAKASLEQEIQRVLKSQTKSSDSLSEKLRHDLAVAYVDSDVFRARIPALQDSVDKITRAIRELPDRERKFDEMDSTIRRHEATYQALLDKEEEVGSQLTWQFQSAVVSEAAEPPDSPAFPVLWLNVAISGILGLIAGVLYAFFLEYLADVRRSMMLTETADEPVPGGGE